MQWWKRPLKQTIAFAILVAAFVGFMVFQIVTNPASGSGALTEEQRFEKLGGTTGTIVVVGLSLIWISSYMKRKSDPS